MQLVEKFAHIRDYLSLPLKVNDTFFNLTRLSDGEIIFSVKYGSSSRASLNARNFLISSACPLIITSLGVRVYFNSEIVERFTLAPKTLETTGEILLIFASASFKDCIMPLLTSTAFSASDTLTFSWLFCSISKSCLRSLFFNKI